MRLSDKAAWVFGAMALCAVLAACSPDNGSSSGTGGGAGSSGFGGAGVGGIGGGGVGGTGGSFCGGVQTRACWCTDGTMTGTQLCNEFARNYGACSCPQVGGTGGGGGGDGALCTMLQGMDCDADTYKSDKLPASILFLVDRSGSMSCNPPPTQTNEECETGMLAATTKDPSMPTKWQLTTDALRTAFDALATSGGAKAALTLFSNNDACGVGSTPSVAMADLTTAHAASLSNALAAVQPAGATPIVGGTLLGYQYLHWEVNPGCTNPPCGAPGNRFVVLITDGADTCSEASDKMALLTTEVQKARMANIRTFVIGAPGSEPARGFLSELAYQGGTARNEATCAHPDMNGAVGDCHFDLTMTSDLAADLQNALGDISGAALTCEFTVPGGATDALNVQFTLDGQSTPLCVPKLADSIDCETSPNSGWQFARDANGGEDRTKVLLCGPACTDVKADLNSKVDVILGCDSLG